MVASCFCRDSRAKDGLYAICRSCHQKKYRDSNRKAVKKHYENNKPFKKNQVKDSRYKARLKLNVATRDGLIIRKPCEVCGDKKTEGHHHDYSKPLDVRWLCTKHHMEIHRKY